MDPQQASTDTLSRLERVLVHNCYFFRGIWTVIRCACCAILLHDGHALKKNVRSLERRLQLEGIPWRMPQQIYDCFSLDIISNDSTTDVSRKYDRDSASAIICHQCCKIYRVPIFWAEIRLEIHRCCKCAPPLILERGFKRDHLMMVSHIDYSILDNATPVHLPHSLQQACGH